jgi:hypothetical protein
MLHTRKPTRVKRVKHVAHRLLGTVQGGGDLRGFPAFRTGERDLAAAHGEGLMAAEPGFERGAFFVGDVSTIQ